MSHKISLRINLYIKYYCIKNIIRPYENIIKDCSICIITTPDNMKIRYLEIYLKSIISIEDFFNICIDLNELKYLPHYNIKLRDINTNDIIYTLKPYTDDEKKDGRLKRKYAKILL